MSSRGSARRASPSSRPYSIRSSANGLENGSRRIAGRSQRTSRDVLLADDLGVGVAEQLVAELDQQPPVLDRQAHDLGEHPHRDLGGDVLDPVELVLLERLLEDPAREPADPLLVRVDDRGVKPLLTSARSRVCGGGSVSSIDLRASTSSGVRSSSDVPPSSDEYVSQSFDTWTMSS